LVDFESIMGGCISCPQSVESDALMRCPQLETSHSMPVLLGTAQENKAAGSPGTALAACVLEDVKGRDSLCVMNSFYDTPTICKTQSFCASPSEITAEWLSHALNANVSSFTTRVCAQGQLGLTVIVEDIKYEPGTSRRPASVAIKIHTQIEQILPIIKLLNAYSRELFFYTSFAAEVPLQSPKVLGVWTDGADLREGCVQKFNLMMENLSDDWEGFDPVSNPPTYEEFERIILCAQEMHVKFWKNPVITQHPFSETGADFSYYEKGKSMRSFSAQLWPTVRATMPQLAGWGSSFPPEFSGMVDFIDHYVADLEKSECLSDVIEEIQKSRPMTLIHGDLNCGNVWRSKSQPDKFLFADWQLLKMAPVGFEFSTMLLILPDDTAVRGDRVAELLRAYHARLPSEMREEYTYSQLHDDLKIHCASLILGVSVIMAGQLDPSSMPAEKHEFTWKSFWPSVFRRLNQLFVDEGIEEFTRQLVEGEYGNFNQKA